MNKYVKRFVESFASENIIGLFSRYPNAYKEISESWALLEAAKKHVGNINDSIVIVIGDGASPRTGAIFAYFTKANVFSIDPNFNILHWIEHYDKQMKMGYTPQRLKLFKLKASEVKINCFNKQCIVIWPHSHAPMNDFNVLNALTRIDIALPCCIPIPNNWMTIPHIVFDDINIISPKRTIHIWKER
ncbi:MAG: hypothetical protein PHW15_02815 [Patescibacteria group bacterium]|nr:hypothetical protein [Patescibacteria group bacterium]